MREDPSKPGMCHNLLLFSFYLPNRDSGSIGPLGPLIDTNAWHSHVIAPTLRIFASLSRHTPHSPMQSTTRDLYVYLYFKYLSSSSYSMYPSLELTLIYTETIALFTADKLKDLARAPITKRDHRYCPNARQPMFVLDRSSGLIISSRLYPCSLTGANR